MTWLGQVGNGSSRPSIVLYASSSIEETAIKIVGAGSEEEGIPLLWGEKDAEAEELARDACMDSPLQVGIGLDEEKIAITFVSYHEEGAYLVKSFDDFDRSVLLRWAGQAAARFVKREPVPGCETDTCSSFNDESIKSVVDIVMAELQRERRR